MRSVPLVAEVAQQLARLAERVEWTGDGDLVFAEPEGTRLNDDKLRVRYSGHSATGACAGCASTTSPARCLATLPISSGYPTRRRPDDDALPPSP